MRATSTASAARGRYALAVSSRLCLRCGATCAASTTLLSTVPCLAFQSVSSTVNPCHRAAGVKRKASLYCEESYREIWGVLTPLCIVKSHTGDLGSFHSIDHSPVREFGQHTLLAWPVAARSNKPEFNPSGETPPFLCFSPSMPKRDIYPEPFCGSGSALPLKPSPSPSLSQAQRGHRMGGDKSRR